MVPGAEADAGEGADDVGDDVPDVEGAAVGEDGLEDFGADAEAGGADEKGEVEGAAAGGVDDPVKYQGEEEEGQEVEDFVVDEGVPLERAEAEVGG